MPQYELQEYSSLTLTDKDGNVVLKSDKAKTNWNVKRNKYGEIIGCNVEVNTED